MFTACLHKRVSKTRKIKYMQVKLNRTFPKCCIFNTVEFSDKTTIYKAGDHIDE